MLPSQTFQSTTFYYFNILAVYKADLRHFISSRAGGYSEGNLGGLNLSFKVGDNPERVEKNRAMVAEYMKVSPDRLIFPVQTHENKVVSVTSKTSADQLDCTDALMTNEKGISIAVMSADCVPVLLYDPVKQAVAAIHAGWRGTVADIVGETVRAMQQQYGTDPKDIVAGIGPSISSEVYEVGEEVIKAVEQHFNPADGVLHFHLNHRRNAMLNLWELNKKLLKRAGVLKENIEISGICTFTHHDLFFSARHSGNTAGRFAAGIMLI